LTGSAKRISVSCGNYFYKMKISFFLWAALSAVILNQCISRNENRSREIFREAAMKNYSLALQAKKNNQPDSALVFISQAIKIKPYISGFYETRAEIYLQLDSLGQAIASYHSALSYRSNNIPVLLNLSALYLQSHDLNAAYSMVSRAISQDGQNKDLYLYGAAIRLQDEKTEAALHLLTRYEKLRSDTGSDYFQALSGVVNNRLQLWQKAVGSFEKIENWPVREKVFLLEYIYALVKSGQPETAYSLLQNHKQNLPAGEFWLGRSIYYHGLQMKEEAAKSMSEALKAGCSNTFLRYYLKTNQADFPGLFPDENCQKYEYVNLPPYVD